MNYRPFYQLPYCCVPATIQWILYRRDLDILDQESIGAELGLRLPEKGRSKFEHPQIKFLRTEPRGGYGTQIEKKRYSINKFFRSHSIPLSISEQFVPKSKETLIDRFLLEQELNNDVILRYHTGIYGTEKSYGHFSLLIDYDGKNDAFTVGNPELPFFRALSTEKLLIAISDKYDGIQRGLYFVTKKDE